MKLKTRILLNVFTASFAATLLQRGIYFFTHAVLDFSQAQNLWLALVVGITYVLGASASHRVSARFGERRTLLSVVALLALVNVGLACVANTFIVCVRARECGSHPISRLVSA